MNIKGSITSEGNEHEVRGGGGGVSSQEEDTRIIGKMRLDGQKNLKIKKKR
jgi:hypothetical protein